MIGDAWDPQDNGTLLRYGAAPLVIGHRGASAVAPENTLPAFEACWSGSVTWIETDVQPTADLVPVLFHDDTLERTSTGAGALRERLLAELAALDVGSWFGARPDASRDYSATRIPTMHQLLTAMPADGNVLLEIKGAHTAAELAIEMDIIRETGTGARVWVQSFEVDVLRDLRDVIPHKWRGLLRDDIDPDPVQLCRELGVASYNPDFHALLAAPEVIGDLHAAGISVIVFTTNDESEWDALTRLGVDGIITDRPTDLLGWQRRSAPAS